MKYSEYVKNRIKRELLKEKPKMSEEEAEKKARVMFKEMLADSFYESALSKLSDDDKLKKLEQEETEYFLDYHRGADKVDGMIPECCLFHGIRFDDHHAKLMSILENEEIRCGNLLDRYYYDYDENCNEGEYVSLTEYTGFEDSLEFDTFVMENVALIISPKVNAIKCKYLSYDEWSKIKGKLPKTKNRYSYARHEYQYKGKIPMDYVIGICYPYFKRRVLNPYTVDDDLNHVKEILARNCFGYLPIYDHSDFFNVIAEGNTYSRRLPLSGIIRGTRI